MIPVSPTALDETKTITPAFRWFCLAGAFITWAVVWLQLVLAIDNRQATIPETIIQFFSYFTILTNLLVACCFTGLLGVWGSRSRKFFSTPQVLTAITVYIVVVGLVYNIVLRILWNPHGLQWVVDEMLHTLIPFYGIVFWCLFAPKTGLQWKNGLPWLIFPFVYLVYVLIRGALSGWYPYPFMEVPQWGYARVFLNCGMLFILFLLVSLLFIATGTAMSRRRSRSLQDD